jgi:hypothetical protein
MSPYGIARIDSTSAIAIEIAWFCVACSAAWTKLARIMVVDAAATTARMPALTSASMIEKPRFPIRAFMVLSR